MAAGRMNKAKATAEKMKRSALGVVRGRASKIGTRLIHPLLRGSDGEGFSMVRGIARAFTAAAQPISARRTSNILDPVSPVEIQQWREQPSVAYWTADNDDVFLPRNHNVRRDDEYLSFSSLESIADSRVDTGADIPPQARVHRLDLDEEGSREFWEYDDIDVIEPEDECLLSRGNDFRTSIPKGVNAEPERHAAPASLHELEGTAVPQTDPRRNGRVFDTEYDFTRPTSAIPAIPAFDALTPRPRQRSRPLVRDSQRRRGRVWDPETDHIFLTALEHATNVPSAQTETISPHLSNQQLEARGPQRPTGQTSGTGTGYAETDTTRYRNLAGAQQGNRRLPPPPPPPPAGPVITVQATVQDARTETRDEVDHPTPLIRSTHFRPVAGSAGHPNRSRVPDTTERGISSTFNRVSGYFASGVDIVTSRAMGLTPGRRQSSSDTDEFSSPTDLYSSPSQGTNGQSVEHSRNRSRSPQRHQQRARIPSSPSRHSNLSKRKLKSLAGLMLTDQEFPTILTRDGPGSRLPMHLLCPTCPPITNSSDEVPPIPEITLISPTTCSSSSFSSSPSGPFGTNGRKRRRSDDSISSGWMSDITLPPAAPSPPTSRPSSSSLESEMLSESSVATSVDEQEAAEEEWKPLSVGTAERVPFAGEWVREFGVCGE
ncbi:MAG: hypothetical protein Q9208_006728 [Pyrenodesmia sp. 3 TL-2023]